MNEILVIKNLSKSYGKHPVINQLNMSIKQGEIYGLLGPNGAGKTTTLRLIAQLIKQDEGTIEYFGSKSDNHLATIYERLSLKTENPYFYDHLTVYQNLKIHLRYLMSYQHETVMEYLDMVNLSHEKDVLAGHLSMGSRQRLAIAKAISSKPSLLLLDEPTNGLDPIGIIDLRNLIKDLSKNRGMTILVSSHILSEIEQIADKVGIMMRGQIIEEIYLDQINKTRENCIRIDLSDAMCAKEILKSDLDIENSEILDSHQLIIRDYKVTIKRIIEILIANQIFIKRIRTEPFSLESYFIELLKVKDIYD